MGKGHIVGTSRYFEHMSSSNTIHFCYYSTFISCQVRNTFVNAKIQTSFELRWIDPAHVKALRKPPMIPIFLYFKVGLH